MRNQINAEFERCFQARLAACQLALDADIDEGLACWKAAPWPEVPASVKPEDIANASICLVELKGVIADLRKCRTKKAADLDACVGPYIGYAPQCPLLKADRVWRLFPGRVDVERVALARRSPEEAKALKEKEAREAKEAKLKAEQAAKDAKLKAEQAAKDAKLKAEQEAKQKAEEVKRAAEEAKRVAEEAKIAKETERCQGRTTLEFAERLKAQPGPRSVPGCKYQVIGRVISKNNVFVQLVDPSGALIVLLRTKEPFAENQAVADRTATFDSIEEAEMADGSKRSFAVFLLEPAPKKK
jgi:hypothetical protein